MAWSRISFTIFFITLVSTLLLKLFWIHSKALYLQKYIPKNERLNTIFFKFSFTFTAISIPFYTIFLLFILSGGVDSLIENQEILGSLGSILIILTAPSLLFFSYVCMLYCYFFAGRTLRSVELQHKASLRESTNYFFIMWRIPLNLTSVQLKLNIISSNYFFYTYDFNKPLHLIS